MIRPVSSHLARTVAIGGGRTVASAATQASPFTSTVRHLTALSTSSLSSSSSTVAPSSSSSSSSSLSSSSPSSSYSSLVSPSLQRLFSSRSVSVTSSSSVSSASTAAPLSSSSFSTAAAEANTAASPGSSLSPEQRAANAARFHQTRAPMTAEQGAARAIARAAATGVPVDIGDVSLVPRNRHERKDAARKRQKMLPKARNGYCYTTMEEVTRCIRRDGRQHQTLRAIREGDTFAYKVSWPKFITENEPIARPAPGEAAVIPGGELSTPDLARIVVHLRDVWEGQSLKLRELRRQIKALPRNRKMARKRIRFKISTRKAPLEAIRQEWKRAALLLHWRTDR